MNIKNSCYDELPHLNACFPDHHFLVGPTNWRVSIIDHTKETKITNIERYTCRCPTVIPSLFLQHCKASVYFFIK